MPTGAGNVKNSQNVQARVLDTVRGLRHESHHERHQVFPYRHSAVKNLAVTNNNVAIIKNSTGPRRHALCDSERRVHGVCIFCSTGAAGRGHGRVQ